MHQRMAYIYLTECWWAIESVNRNHVLFRFVNPYPVTSCFCSLNGGPNQDSKFSLGQCPCLNFNNLTEMDVQLQSLYIYGSFVPGLVLPVSCVRETVGPVWTWIDGWDLNASVLCEWMNDMVTCNKLHGRQPAYELGMQHIYSDENSWLHLVVLQCSCRPRYL